MTVEHKIIFMLQASDLASLSSVYPQRWSLPQEIWVRGRIPKWDSREGLVSHMIMTCCSSMMDGNWKGQITDRALTVTKGPVGQVEGIVGKFPSTLYGKKCPALLCGYRLRFCLLNDLYCVGWAVKLYSLTHYRLNIGPTLGLILWWPSCWLPAPKQ